MLGRGKELQVQAVECQTSYALADRIQQFCSEDLPDMEIVDIKYSISTDNDHFALIIFKESRK